MKGRHIKLAGIFLMLFFLCFASGLFIYVMVHHKHMWSLFVNAGFLFLGFMSPACCFGYNMEDPGMIIHGGSMTEQSYLNWRDVGYMFGLVFYLLTYVIPTVAWARSDGLNPGVWTTVIIYVGNACFGYAFVLWFVIFIMS
jgi:hypothetical protein